MGPTFALIILMFALIATVVVGTLVLMPGWKSSLALFAAYAAGLAYVSLSPQLAEGQMNRAAIGLAWAALALAGLVRTVVLLKRRSNR